MCSTRTRGTTMRASVADLILAANTSHIILYKENIEGETVTGRGTAASNKGPCHTLGCLSLGEGGAVREKIGARKPRCFPSVLLSEGNTNTLSNSSPIWPQVRQRGPLCPSRTHGVSEDECQAATLGPTEGATSAAWVPSRSVLSDILGPRGL